MLGAPAHVGGAAKSSACQALAAHAQRTQGRREGTGLSCDHPGDALLFTSVPRTVRLPERSLHPPLPGRTVVDDVQAGHAPLVGVMELDALLAVVHQRQVAPAPLQTARVSGREINR